MAHPQGGSSSTVSRSNWNVEMLVLRRGENRSTWRKRFRSKDENQQQTLPTYDAESGTRTRAAPTTAPSLLPCLSVNSGFIWRLIGFYPFLLMYRHIVAVEPARPLHDSCFAIFLVELPCVYFAFLITVLVFLLRTADLLPVLGLSSKSSRRDHHFFYPTFASL